MTEGGLYIQWALYLTTILNPPRPHYLNTRYHPDIYVGRRHLEKTLKANAKIFCVMILQCKSKYPVFPFSYQTGILYSSFPHLAKQEK